MKKIKFTKNFSSPVYGNVWIGRELNVKPKEAEKYANMGWAEYVETINVTTKKDNEVKTLEKVENNGDSKSKRGKKSFARRSK